MTDSKSLYSTPSTSNVFELSIKSNKVGKELHKLTHLLHPWHAFATLLNSFSNNSSL